MKCRCAGFASACSQWLDGLVLRASRSLGVNVRTIKILAVASLIVLLTGLSASQITGNVIKDDAIRNLRLAFSYARHGVYSMDVSPPYLPSNAREPLPNFVAALHLRSLGLSSPDSSFSDLIQGNGARLVKLVNLYWVILGLTATAALVSELVNSFALVVLSTTLAGVFFFASPLFVDTLYTELHAAVLMLWASFFLLKSSVSGKKAYFVLAGLALGALSLTKAVFYYISIAFLGFLIVRLLVRIKSKATIASSLASIMLMIASFVLAVGPWIVRNKLELGTMQLAQRGGRVLYARAMKNNMENQEIPGALYFWGPSLYQRASRLLGFGALPQDFQRGGRYQRINREGSDFRQSDLAAESLGRPQNAISYKRKMGAEIVKIKHYAVRMGIANPDLYAEQVVSRRARSMILMNPVRHIAMTPLFMWRGIWAWPNQGVRIVKSNGFYVMVKDVLGLISYISLFAVFSLGLLRGHRRYLAITFLPVAMLLFYGLLTHNLPRYSAPAIPLMIISVAVLIRHIKVYSGNQNDRNKKLASAFAVDNSPG